MIYLVRVKWKKKKINFNIAEEYFIFYFLFYKIYDLIFFLLWCWDRFVSVGTIYVIKEGH